MGDDEAPRFAPQPRQTGREDAGAHQAPGASRRHRHRCSEVAGGDSGEQRPERGHSHEHHRVESHDPAAEPIGNHRLEKRVRARHLQHHAEADRDQQEGGEVERPREREGEQADSKPRGGGGDQGPEAAQSRSRRQGQGPHQRPHPRSQCRKQLIRARSDDDDWQARVLGSQPLEGFPPVLLRQIQIQQDQIHTSPRCFLYRFLAIAGATYQIIFVLQHAPQHPAHASIVIQQQDPFFHQSKKIPCGRSRA